MHFLDRSAVNTPACIALLDHRQHVWDGCCCGGGCQPGRCPLFRERKAEIRAALNRLQADRCAYCEAPLYSGGHIEHFRRKHRDHFPELTFDWGNLFLSCDGPDRCGHFKDRRNAPAYSPDQLVKPDQHDPERFLFFHSRGEVLPRGGIEPEDHARAKETIRILGLNDPALQDLRRKAVASYLAARQLWDEVEALSPEERREFLNAELRAAETRPFRTAIHHFLKRYL